MDYQEVKQIESRFGSPLIVYDRLEMIDRYNLVKDSFNCKDFQILYCVKSNSNLSLLKIYKELGADVDVCSPGDVYVAKQAGFGQSQIFATGPNWSDKDLDYFQKEGVNVDLDSISQINRYGRINPGSDVGIRINLGFGKGFHEHTYAGGEDSKLGIVVDNLDKAIGAAKDHGLKIVRLHYHLFSGELEVESFVDAFKACLKLLKKFPCVSTINIGGGIGVPFHPSEKDFDMKRFGKEISDSTDKHNLKIMIELGEFLIEPCGVAVGKINTVKDNGDVKFIGTNLNSNFLTGYYLYKTHYEFITMDGGKEKVTVAGNLCQAGDLMVRDRMLSGTEEGEAIAVKNAGAYSQAKAGRFNSRLKPTEVLRIEKGKYEVIFKDSFENLIEGMNKE